MNITINTNLLQKMVSKAMRGASQNKMIPLTGLMNISIGNGNIKLVTTDGTNYLYVEDYIGVADDFEVVVQTSIFSKLIARMTCETITMSLENQVLKVKGNGTYMIDLPLDENGNLIKYPDPIKLVESTEQTSIVNNDTIQDILHTAKISLSTEMDIPCYTGYYVGDEVISTDTYKVCSIKNKIFTSPVLISSELMDLVGVIDAEQIMIVKDGDTLVFKEYCDDVNNVVAKSERVCVYGKVMNGIEDFQIDAIKGLLNESFDSVCTLSQVDLLKLLDRLSLFVSVYDKNGVYLTFTNDGLIINSKQDNSSELINYQSSTNFKPFTCCVDIEMFQSQIKASTSNTIELHYGKDNALKFTNGNTTQLLALLSDD